MLTFASTYQIQSRRINAKQRIFQFRFKFARFDAARRFLLLDASPFVFETTDAQL